ncbi:helix-turn-helix transcriptional regulator [Kocuria sp.]|uniref:helix-turn-helix domain-containing protein n=1 Tax=Kocuria sp. TaxID=1871328 RepID=UPI0028A5EB16|nr:helix-turn-helix transcriptional regulator [Kocuria sp.]
MTKSDEGLPAQLAVAGNVRAALAEAGTTRKEVARRLQMSEGAFNSRCKGTRAFDVAQLQRVALVLDVPFSRLVTWEEK